MVCDNTSYKGITVSSVRDNAFYMGITVSWYIIIIMFMMDPVGPMVQCATLLRHAVRFTTGVSRFFSSEPWQSMVCDHASYMDLRF